MSLISWVPHDIRDTIVDFVRVWSDKTEIAADRFVAWIGMARGKFFAWKKRYGKANEHNVISDNYFCRSTTIRFAGSSTSGQPR